MVNYRIDMYGRMRVDVPSFVPTRDNIASLPKLFYKELGKEAQLIMMSKAVWKEVSKLFYNEVDCWTKKDVDEHTGVIMNMKYVVFEECENIILA